MAKDWKRRLQDLGARARELLAEIGALAPEPELQPVRVRNTPTRRPDPSSR